MRLKCRASLVAFILALGVPAAAHAQPGVYLPGSGAVQAGMGGVSTAAPLDAIGALYWNPAAIGRLGRNEVSIGGAFLYPDISVSSSVPQTVTGGANFGRTRSDSGFPLASSLGVVFKNEPDSPLTYGLGLFSLGGGGVNFPGDPNNPILSPTGPLGRTVLGPIFSSMQLYQLNPTVAYQVTDRLVVGAGPTIDITMPTFDPAFFASPDRDATGRLVFPTATHARPFWGGGFRLGSVYSVTDTLDVGFGYTSPQWLESWKFYARTPDGVARTLTLNATLPAIYSLGIAWRGVERLTLGVDLRYFDYHNADLFGTPVRDGGLGWDSAFAAAFGGNYQLTDRVVVRAGYQYNTNPLASTSTLFNIQAPAILQNTISLGTTVNMTESLAFSMGYAYGFKNTINGTASQVPGAAVSVSAASHALLFNLQVKFGPSWKTACNSPYEAAPASPAATLTTPSATAASPVPAR
jgi:long-chain fatty acid transport protein